MSPHRLTTSRRFTVPDDVLILILENLDPAALWRACAAFRRLYVIAMEYQPLRYNYELAVTGMKDGPASGYTGPPHSRMQLLLAYKKGWPTLHWIHECKKEVPTPSHLGVSGGFLHQIRVHGSQYALELAELPSYRTGRPPSMTRHLSLTTNQIESVTVDHSQALVVTSHIARAQDGQDGVQLQFRDLWAFGKHPRAFAVVYDLSPGGSTRVSKVNTLICGAKIAISLEFSGGRVKHLLLEWRTFEARWFDGQDILFLNENQLFVAKQSSGTPILSLYNISHVSNVSVEREYELPEAWGTSVIGFSPNTAPMGKLSSSSNALFYPDPSTRVLLITAKPGGPPSTSRSQGSWLCINESYFRPSSRKDRLKVPWNQWGQYCVRRDLPPSTTAIKGPRVIGTRVVYLDSSSGGGVSRLNVIQFAPYPDTACQSRAWSLGPRTMLVPIETSREVPATTVDCSSVDDIRVTEDNIVLFLESERGARARRVNILTFGVPPRSASSNHHTSQF